MTTPSTETNNGSLTRDLLYAARYYLGSGRGLLILAVVAIAGGLALNWDWLVAAGIAPILIAVLPCAIMCGLGLCMNRLFGNSCESQATRSNAAEPTRNTATQSSIPLAAEERTHSLPSCCHERANEGAIAEPKEPSVRNERSSSDA